jgi:hypothetical protein
VDIQKYTWAIIGKSTFMHGHLKEGGFENAQYFLEVLLLSRWIRIRHSDSEKIGF